MSRKIIIIIAILAITVQACRTQQELEKNMYKVPGTIAKTDIFYCEVFNSEKKIGKFQIMPKRKDFNGKENIYYSGFDWFGKDSLLASEKIEVGYEAAGSNSLVVLNLEGKVIERIINNEKYHYTGASVPTRSRKKILFTSYVIVPPQDRQNPKKEELLASLDPREDLQIMAYPSRHIELSIEGFSKGGMLGFNESPWSPDEKRFVYTIQKKPLITLQGEEISDKDTTAGGSYIFEIESKKDIKFIPGSYAAIWSPTSNIIAYLKKRNIWLYDVDKDIHIPFIGSTADFKINHIHWTPDGEYIYVQGVYKGKLAEKLYCVKDEKEIPFKKLGLTEPYYTWQ